MLLFRMELIYFQSKYMVFSSRSPFKNATPSPIPRARKLTRLLWSTSTLLQGKKTCSTLEHVFVKKENYDSSFSWQNKKGLRSLSRLVTRVQVTVCSLLIQPFIISFSLSCFCQLHLTSTAIKAVQLFFNHMKYV